MSGGRIIPTNAAAAERRLGDMETPQRAVSLFDHDLGQGLTRTEFITNGERGQDYWPALQAWPPAVAENLLRAARRWMLAHPGRRLIATSCTVETTSEPPQCILHLHHVEIEASPGGPLASLETDGEDAPAAGSRSRDLPLREPLSPPPPAHCPSCGE